MTNAASYADMRDRATNYVWTESKKNSGERNILLEYVLTKTCGFSRSTCDQVMAMVAKEHPLHFELLPTAS